MARIDMIDFGGLRRLNPFKTGQPHSNRTGPYRMGDINIFSGKNGAGKSTVLDLVSVLRDPGKLATLPRENRKSDNLSFFYLKFNSGAVAFASVTPNALSEAAPLEVPAKSPVDVQCLSLEIVLSTNEKFGFFKNVSKHSLDKKSITEIEELLSQLKCKVSCWGPAEILSTKALAIHLNDLAPHLTGLSSDTTLDLPRSNVPLGWATHQAQVVFAFNEDEEIVGVYHSDDMTQLNRVRISTIPSGWRTAASLMDYVSLRQEGEICLLEEPEIHMHPALQRAVVRYMARVVHEKKLQLFISTHSPTLQSRFLWDEELDVHFFEMDGPRMHEGINERRLFKALGISGAEYGACNGLIWVEGPSDRIYLEHWIDLYCTHSGIARPREHIAYSYAYHGGAVLKHFDLGDGSDKINIARINRNFMLVMDQDLDFAATDGNNRINNKKKIIDLVNELNAAECATYLTPGYTIEASLPKVFREKYFKYDGRRLVLERGKKVVIATKYTQQYKDWLTCFDPSYQLEGLIQAITTTIFTWQLD